MSEKEREKHISTHHEEEQESGDTKDGEPEHEGAEPAGGETPPDA
jgi:hypothetical protein